LGPKSGFFKQMFRRGRHHATMPKPNDLLVPPKKRHFIKL
jgi:hypothetical protein